MPYLYGDSSPSPLESNFVEFLRDAVEFGVQVVLAGQRIVEGRERAAAHRQAADVETRRLDALGAEVQRAIAGAVTGAADSPAHRCAEAIGKSAGELVRTEREGVRARLAKEVARIDADSAQQRAACVKALEALLKRHDLPQTVASLSLNAVDGERYTARLHHATPYGVVATMDLAIPPAHALAHPLRIDRVLDRVELPAPDLSGWIQKKVKVRAQRLEKHYLVELAARPGETLVRLRASPNGEGDGFDLVYRGTPARAFVTRIDEQNAPVGDVLELTDADATRAMELHDRLGALAGELAAHRGALVEAHFDGKPLSELPEPFAIVERLVGASAPVVQEIARHSLSPNELVLKRLLSDGRREECFVSKSELDQKLAALPDTWRPLFAPMGLGPISAAAPPPTPPVAAPVSAPPGPPPLRRSAVPKSAMSRPLPLVQRVRRAEGDDAKRDDDEMISLDSRSLLLVADEPAADGAGAEGDDDAAAPELEESVTSSPLLELSEPAIALSDKSLVEVPDLPAREPDGATEAHASGETSARASITADDADADAARDTKRDAAAREGDG